MAHLRVALRAFVPSQTSFGWIWVPWSGDDPLARETVQSTDELPRLLRSYGSVVAFMLRPTDAGERFIITVYGAGSGLVYGRDEWAWEADLGRYTECGEPWVPRSTKAPQDLSREASTDAPMSRLADAS